MENKLNRPDRDAYFMVLAYLVASRGTCEKQQVGCVLVHNHRIVATGYNSSFPGTPHCPGVDLCISNAEGRCRRVLHAEVSAVLSLSRNYKGLTAYITHEPCSQCYQIMTQAGVTKILYSTPYTSNPADSAIKDQLIRMIGVIPQYVSHHFDQIKTSLEPLTKRYGLQLHRDTDPV